MSLAKEVQEIKAASERKCRVAEVAGGMEGNEGPELMALAEDPSYAYSHIIAALNRRGIQMSDKVLSAHRSGKCKCPR